MVLTWTGNGRGTAVLLHGMMSLAGTWWQIGPALAERGWDVTALDLAAHGGQRLAGPLTADALVDSVTSQVSGPVDLLVGHSMGAATAASTVVRHPGFARAVVLEDPPGGMARGSDEMAHGVELDAGIARLDRERLVRRSRADHPTWAASDVEYDVAASSGRTPPRSWPGCGRDCGAGTCRRWCGRRPCRSWCWRRPSRAAR